MFPMYLFRNSISVCWNPQHKSSCFPEMINLRGHMPKFTLKNEQFPIYLLRNPIKCVLKPSEQGLFFWDDQFEGSHAYVYLLKMNEFPIYLLWKPINMCWNLQNRAHFSKMIKLRETCLVLSLRNFSHKYVLGNPQNRVCCPETINLRGHMPRFTVKWMISYLSPEKSHKYVLKSSEQGLLSWENQFEGSHA